MRREVFPRVEISEGYFYTRLAFFAEKEKK